MSAAAIALILAAAVAHASWNVVMKRSEGGPRFLFVSGALAAVLWAPLAIGLAVRSEATLRSTVLAIAVSGCFHLTYFLTLQAGYRAGDLSLVYPLARGTGPAISVIAAIVIRHERPAVLALVGAGAVVAGIFALARGHAAGRAAIAFGLGTGVVIAGYTLWDKHVVDDLLVSGVTLSWGTETVRALVLAPVGLRSRDVVDLRDALAFAVLSPLAYMLVLAALATTDVAFVAPAREVSIVIGVVLGRVVLGEHVTRRRLLAAAVVASGVILLALG
jgi:drug/metabolite transporter (DMT)-like permease